MVPILLLAVVPILPLVVVPIPLLAVVPIPPPGVVAAVVVVLLPLDGGDAVDQKRGIVVVARDRGQILQGRQGVVCRGPIPRGH